MFVVHDVQCRYLQSFRLNDELIVEVEIERTSGARMRFSQRALRVVDNSLLCTD